MTVSSTYNGWSYDRDNARLDVYYRGTRAGHFSASGFSTPVGLAVTVGDVGLADDLSIELGTDDDSVLRHRTGTLSANTGLTDVLTGTPVSQALAANSLMVSNLTANGDIALYVNTGTVSEQAVFIDGSAKVAYIGQTGWAVNVVEAAVKMTLGTPTAFGTTQPTNTLVFKTGTAPAGTITTSCGIFTDGTTLKKIIAANTVSDIQT